jgi:hypothetical protein
VRGGDSFAAGTHVAHAAVVTTPSSVKIVVEEKNQFSFFFTSFSGLKINFEMFL